MRIALWNIEWAASSSARGIEIKRRLGAAAPDIVCLTEADRDFVGAGHQIESAADYGYPIVAGRRKVLLRSRWKWLTHFQVGSGNMPPGRYVGGTTATPIGELRIIGVCIPWSGAHVSSGRRDRVRWEDHVAYLAGFSERVARFDTRTIILGDFNQTIPRSRQPLPVAEQLSAVLTPALTVATRDQTDPNGKPAIDHLAHTRDLHATVVDVLPAVTTDGLRLSDHFGWVLELSQARVWRGRLGPSNS